MMFLDGLLRHNLATVDAAVEIKGPDLIVVLHHGCRDFELTAEEANELSRVLHHAAIAALPLVKR